MSVLPRDKKDGPQVTGNTLVSVTKKRGIIPWLLALLLLFPGGDLGADPAPAASGSTSTKKAKKARKVKSRRKKTRRKRRARTKKHRTKKRWTRKARRKRSRRKRARRRKRRTRTVATVAATRCKDIFCTSRVMALEGEGSSFKQLSSTQVELVMHRSLARLEPCLVRERRKNPHLKGATIEFVVSRKGRVLASRLQQRQRAELQKCLQKAMRPLRFPRVKGRTVATFTIHVPR